ncbi:unnamed protein product [Hymenolepis diminuta]|uniref:Uncharacterized protein n=1 Tax=Hymenolepis diminuta TaxID=6216 RepID=A0A564YWN9_HYMDI|nr:unnamed protein product [Hymenolepis diminuta]VUZ51575.1 unnamed protein product [Hymenolepis diminuta]VUZ51576.1 unnamed protein product [Hymenolepis diminuta]
MLKKLNSEQLEVGIDENPACTTRELSKTFNASLHTTIYREVERLGWEGLIGWQMGPTRFVRNQQPTACDLLCSTVMTILVNFRHLF